MGQAHAGNAREGSTRRGRGRRRRRCAEIALPALFPMRVLLRVVLCVRRIIFSIWAGHLPVFFVRQHRILVWANLVRVIAFATPDILEMARQAAVNAELALMRLQYVCFWVCRTRNVKI